MNANPIESEQARAHKTTRTIAIVAVVVAFLSIGGIALSHVPGTNGNAGASDLTDVERAQNLSVQQVTDGMVPYADDAPYEGPAVTGWLSVKPSATSLAPEYDTVHKRIPVHSDEGSINGYDYTYIGFVPLAIADSGNFDEAAVRTRAFGGCDPLALDVVNVKDCIDRGWTKPHA